MGYSKMVLHSVRDTQFYFIFRDIQLDSFEFTPSTPGFIATRHSPIHPHTISLLFLMATLKKKILVVVAATGNQGSSVARTFLALPGWHVRCLTRNLSSPKALELQLLGAEIVQGDMSDITSLQCSFLSANAIFANTDFWATYRDPKTSEAAAAQGKTISEYAFETEVSYGVNIARAATAVPTLERFIYSALGPVKSHSAGKYTHSYHWDSKATIVDYIKNKEPELAKKMSLIYMGVYVTNALFTPRFDAKTRRSKFIAPMKKNTRIPIINAPQSTGPFVRALIEDEEPGRSLLAYDSCLELDKVVDIWSKATGKDGEYREVQITKSTIIILSILGKFPILQRCLARYQGFDIPPLEIIEAPAFISEFGYMGGVEGAIEPSDLKNKVVVEPFEDWLIKQNKS